MGISNNLSNFQTLLRTQLPQHNHRDNPGTCIKTNMHTSVYYRTIKLPLTWPEDKNGQVCMNWWSYYILYKYTLTYLTHMSLAQTTTRKWRHLSSCSQHLTLNKYMPTSNLIHVFKMNYTLKAIIFNSLHNTEWSLCKHSFTTTTIFSYYFYIHIYTTCMYSVLKMKIKCKDSATNKMFKMNNVHTVFFTCP